MQTNLFLEFKRFRSFSENNWIIEPSVCGSEPRRPIWELDDFKNTANAEKKDSPKPTIAE
ncbi:hypothetical protein J4413_01895 [Candidatus Woesearchaeota archaeon]|nr:hypothetical protein [Candidatus Woesearchaeota archaeon]